MCCDVILMDMVRAHWGEHDDIVGYINGWGQQCLLLPFSSLEGLHHWTRPVQTKMHPWTIYEKTKINMKTLIDLPNTYFPLFAKTCCSSSLWVGSVTHAPPHSGAHAASLAAAGPLPPQPPPAIHCNVWCHQWRMLIITMQIIKLFWFYRFTWFKKGSKLIFK